jgi:hypothetical protein
MSKRSDTGTRFTIEKLRWDDPRLKQFREIPAEELQPSFHATIQLISGSDELEIEDLNLWHQFQLTDEDFDRLQSLGLKGKLRVTGRGTSGYPPFKARSLIVAERQIKEAVDLPQPNGCAVAYYQVGDEWRKFPAEAPVLKRRFRLSIDSENEHVTNMWQETYFGSESGGGGGAFNWSRASESDA